MPVLAVFGTIIFHVVPPSVELSILYPVIGEPPLLNGEAQEMLIWFEETNAATSPVGGSGAVAALVVSEKVLDGKLVPAELIAEIRKE